MGMFCKPFEKIIWAVEGYLGTLLGGATAARIGGSGAGNPGLDPPYIVEISQKKGSAHYML